MLIQKRSANKRFSPNKWGLCAGHVDAYETIEQAALRELNEELGVIAEIKDLVYFDHFIINEGSNSRISYFYYLFLNQDAKDFILQEEELSEVKWISYQTYYQKVVTNDPEITNRNTLDTLAVLSKLKEILLQRNKNS